MILGTAMWNVWDAASLALTPLERWSAVRRVDPRPPHEYSPLLLILVLLLALVVLLWLVSRRRKPRRPAPSRELFWDEAVRRFGAREREILAAIAARSGLRRREDVVTVIDAFDRGATTWLKEIAASQTPEELARLRTDVARLRERLASRRSPRAEARVIADEHAHPTSMSIPGAVARFPAALAGSLADSSGGTQPDWFEFAQAAATQIEGSTVQISSTLPVQAGDAIFVILRLPSALRGETNRDADQREHLMGHIGRVTGVKAEDGGTLITLELIGVAEMETAAQFAGTAGSSGS